MVPLSECAGQHASAASPNIHQIIFKLGILLPKLALGPTPYIAALQP